MGVSTPTAFSPKMRVLWVVSEEVKWEEQRSPPLPFFLRGLPKRGDGEKVVR